MATTATVGITKYAAEQLGDVVLSNCRKPAARSAQGGEAAVVESVKAASEVYAPVGGEVTAANAALADEPAKVNADPEGEGWFFKLKLADKARVRQADDRGAIRRVRERTSRSSCAYPAR